MGERCGDSQCWRAKDVNRISKYPKALKTRTLSCRKAVSLSDAGKAIWHEMGPWDRIRGYLDILGCLNTYESYLWNARLPEKYWSHFAANYQTLTHHIFIASCEVEVILHFSNKSHYKRFLNYFFSLWDFLPSICKYLWPFVVHFSWNKIISFSSLLFFPKVPHSSQIK